MISHVAILYSLIWKQHFIPVVFFPNLMIELMVVQSWENIKQTQIEGVSQNTLQKHQGHEKQGKTEELSQIRRD